jgi:hypothetical protein
MAEAARGNMPFNDVAADHPNCIGNVDAVAQCRQE